MSYPDNGQKRLGDVVMSVHPYSAGRYPLGRVEHVDTYRRSTDGSTVHDIRVRTGPGSTVHSSADQWTVVTLHDENGALRCPECGEEVWDGPQGSKLAKCWNAEGHADGRTLAFDTMEEGT